MSDDNYRAGPTEHKIIGALDKIIEDVLEGRIAGLGVCGVKKDGTPIYFFMDGAPPERGLLVPVIHKLNNIYSDRKRFAGNAPLTNRSHGIH